MRSHIGRRFFGLVLAFACVAAACGDDGESDQEASDTPAAGASSEVGDDDAGTTTEATTADGDDDAGTTTDAATTDGDDDAGTTTEASSTDTDEGSGADTTGEVAATTLADACPSPLKIQTDWFPEAEHGATYQLIGPDAEIDGSAGIYSGTIKDPFTGEDTGVVLEIRAGGPFLGGQPTEQVMYTDRSIQLGYSGSDSQLDLWERFPLVLVLAPLEVSPAGVMWDPDMNPDFETFADVRDSGIPVFYFATNRWIDWLAWAGELDPDQLDPSWDGSPVRYATENIAQSAFVSNQPYTYEFDIPPTQGRPVKWILSHDAGYETYQGAIGVRPDFIEEEPDCLELFIPMYQQAIIDYALDPGPVDAAMIQYVADLASFWVLSEGLNQFAVKTMLEAGIVGNGDDDTIGNLDPARVERFHQTYLQYLLDTTGTELSVDPDELYTNQFIDPNIGL